MDDRVSPLQNSNGSIRSCDLVRPFNHHPVTLPTPKFWPVDVVGDKLYIKNKHFEEEDVSGSQTKTKPFDICTPKQSLLKPPLLRKNRERGKEKNQSSKEVELRPGMYHLKGYISLTDQVKIVKVCRELGLGDGGFYQPCNVNGTMLHLKRMCLGRNWDHETSQYGYLRPSDGSYCKPVSSKIHIPSLIPVTANQFPRSRLTFVLSIFMLKMADLVFIRTSM